MMHLEQTDTFRESVLSVLGAPPDPAPLQPATLEIVELRNGLRREKVQYYVSPNELAYAYLFVPPNIQHGAAVFVHHRHGDGWAIGKSEPAGLLGNRDYALALELAERGYVTFAPDALGFEDRRGPGSTGDAFDQAYHYHQLAIRLLRGETLLKKALWDIARGIDFLETRPEVDPKRVGFIGAEYGGKMAFWSAALEPRIRAAVSHGPLMTFKEQIRRLEWLQPEFIVPRLMQVADMTHILSMAAPRPFLISASQDNLDDSNSGEVFQKALDVYKKHGAENRLSLYLNPQADGFNRMARQRAYDWLDCWLMPY